MSESIPAADLAPVRAFFTQPPVLSVHSPLPWLHSREGAYSRIVSIPRLQHVAAISNTGPDNVIDGEAIVLAVNHHDLLVHTLQRLIDANHPSFSEEFRASVLRDAQALVEQIRGA